MTLELTRAEQQALDAALWHYILKLEAEPKSKNNIKEHALRKAKHLELVKELRQKVMAGKEQHSKKLPVIPVRGIAGVWDLDGGSCEKCGNRTHWMTEVVGRMAYWCGCI